MIINIAGVNAFVLYNSYKNNDNVTRFEFLKQLAKGLAEPYMNQRLFNNKLPRELRLSIGRILKKTGSL